ncbi:hypothetical protein HJG60_008019 [Phyllostomus discolor]|uniref:Uncharacterized protein n=1 Tax=Phyllostomus discolor TaxID=89673 RepID=A0A834BHZ6_9CHIR|nr:hypothetical protein HJG60_008019 [Phyllostomus discolor]
METNLRLEWQEWSPGKTVGWWSLRDPVQGPLACQELWLSEVSHSRDPEIPRRLGESAASKGQNGTLESLSPLCDPCGDVLCRSDRADCWASCAHSGRRRPLGPSSIRSSLLGLAASELHDHSPSALSYSLGLLCARPTGATVSLPKVIPVYTVCCVATQNPEGRVLKVFLDGLKIWKET